MQQTDQIYQSQKYSSTVIIRELSNIGTKPECEMNIQESSWVLGEFWPHLEAQSISVALSQLHAVQVSQKWDCQSVMITYQFGNFLLFAWRQRWLANETSHYAMMKLNLNTNDAKFKFSRRKMVNIGIFRNLFFIFCDTKRILMQQKDSKSLKMPNIQYMNFIFSTIFYRSLSITAAAVIACSKTWSIYWKMWKINLKS